METHPQMTRSDPVKSLQNIVDQTPDLVGYFYNDTLAPHFRARTGLTAQYIPPAFTNWRDEQRAWRESAVLFDQSHHMPELFLKGPDALRLLTRLGINSFAGFTADRAKQFVACTPQGHVIGDCVLYNLGDGSFELVSGMTVLNWVHYQADAGGYDVSVVRDDPTPYNPKGSRTKYRFQLSGPRAQAILDAAVGGAPEVPFFRTARVTIAGRDVLALGHGMAAHRSVELSGPYDDMDAVRDAIMHAGEPHGLLRGGTQAYFSATLESGWIPYPLPGIYTDDALRGFREWLPADGWEASQQLGGSFYSADIEDYYVTPWDLGYGRILKFDHDFTGRAALEKLAGQPRRSKVTLVWNTDDVLRVYASQFGDGPRYKSLGFPLAVFGWPHYDEVRAPDGRLVGLSTQCGYSANEGAVLSLAMLDHDHARPGTQVELTWGEPGGGSRKPHVERHEITRIRATVAPVPYAAVAREMKSAR